MPSVSDSDKEKIHLFTQKCLNIRKNFYLGTFSLTPINYKEEKEKFFSTPHYNPHFNYRQRDYSSFTKSLNEVEDFLHSLSLPPDLKDYLKTFLNDTRLIDQTIKSIGTQEFAEHAKEIFNLDNPTLQKYLNTSPDITISEEENSQLYSAEEIAEIFKKTLSEKYNITDYEIKIDHFNDHIIRVGNKKVILGGQIKRYRKSIERLIIHELESHVLQRINARRNILLSLATYGDRTLYGEGLAVYNEVTAQKLTLKMYRLYSLRLKAVRLLDRSFREIYEKITGGVPDNLAFQITYRVKRGLHDTSMPGGYPKDAFYLLGYMAVKDYMDNGGSIKDLYKFRAPQLKDLIEKYDLVDFQDHTPLLPHFIKKHV